MKNIYPVLILTLVLSGCAAGKMVLVNPEKTAGEIRQDRGQCNASGDEEKFNQCMQEKGYKLVPEKEASRVKGFKEAWVNPDTDFKGYEVIFIEKVDVSQAKVKNMQTPKTKVTDDDIDNLGKEMLERFSKILNTLMPVVQDKGEISGRKAVCISLKLKDIAHTSVGFNAALQVVGTVTKIPMPVSSQGLFSFEGEITDFASQEKLITLSDESKSDKNASLAGFENFEKWQHAYNTMDYWADCLAALLAAKRGEVYKSQLGLKLVSL